VIWLFCRCELNGTFKEKTHPHAQHICHIFINNTVHLYYNVKIPLTIPVPLYGFRAGDEKDLGFPVSRKKRRSGSLNAVERCAALRPPLRRTPARPRYGAQTPHQYGNYVPMVPMHILQIPCPARILHRKPLPSSPATSAPLQPPPLSLCAQVRPAAAARGGNARRICPNLWPDLCCRWINFWLCFQSSAFEMPPHKTAFFPIQRRRNLLV
jgi:hypothetical protein